MASDIQEYCITDYGYTAICHDYRTDLPSRYRKSGKAKRLSIAICRMNRLLNRKRKNSLNKKAGRVVLLAVAIYVITKIIHDLAISVIFMFPFSIRHPYQNSVPTSVSRVCI